MVTDIAIKQTPTKHDGYSAHFGGTNKQWISTHFPANNRLVHSYCAIKTRCKGIQLVWSMVWL